MAERCMTLLKNVLPSNGSRLNCGRNANRRKVVEEMRRCGSEATQGVSARTTQVTGGRRRKMPNSATITAAMDVSSRTG